MSEADAVIERSLSDPARVCPVLAGPAIVRGSKLRVRLREAEHEVTAPPRYLSRLYDWCDGTRSLSQIGELARQHGLAGSFLRLLGALLDAGILVDAAAALDTTAHTVRYPSLFGMAAAPDVWKRVITPLPPALPAGLQKLPTPPSNALSKLLERRRSAAAFSGGTVGIEALAAIVLAMYGSVDASGRHRSVASAGSFYRLTVTLCLLQPVGTYATGIYRVRYAQGTSGLERAGDAPGFLPRAFVQPLRLRNASFAAVISCDMAAGRLKYRNRFYPYACIEAGAAFQNAALACADAGVGWRLLGGFDEDMLSGMLHLEKETPLITAVAGIEATTTDTPRRDVRAGWVHSMPHLPFVTATATAYDASGQPGRACWGRDPDPKIALDKAVAEAVERQAYRVRRHVVIARACELEGPWMHPDLFVRYAAWQRRRTDFPFAAFDSQAERPWVRASKRDGTGVFVAAELVYHRTSFGDDERSRLVTHASSSGCASHRSAEDALQAAVFELVERDAFSRHWLAQQPGRGVKASSLPEDLRGEVRALNRAGVSTHLQVLTGGVGPVWMVIMQSASRRFTCMGAASGIEPEAALRSAFNEACTGAQVRLSSQVTRTLRPGDVRTPRDHADLYAQARHHRKADALIAARASADFNTIASSWPVRFADVEQAIRQRGSEILHVDLTLDDAPPTWDGTGLQTVRALVPGLVPLAFGHLCMPFGMVEQVAAGARFPHPFP